MTDLFTQGPGYEVIRMLEEAGHEAVFVGGAVRDHLLNKEPKDIDIATSAELAEVKAIFRNTIDIGLAHGTVLVVLNGEPIEVTTYRTEGTYTDHRRPDDVQFVKSLHEDLLRRDFTMNAIALTKDGELIDPFDGRKDMDSCLIRAVGNPSDRFQEDALRMLRAIRFSSVLDYTIEEKTFHAICTYAEQIRHISVERVKIELDKLFTGKNIVHAFWYMEKSGLHQFLPLFPNRTSHLGQAIPFATALEGWAYLAIEGDYSSSIMSKAYKLSTSERKIIMSIKELFEKRISRLYTIDDYYAYEVHVLETTEKLFRAFYPEDTTVTAEEMKSKKQALPIQSMADITVSGKDLIQWACCKGGKWTGEWMEKIEFAVLHQTCENDPTTIKEWFLYEFNREK